MDVIILEDVIPRTIEISYLKTPVMSDARFSEKEVTRYNCAMIPRESDNTVLSTKQANPQATWCTVKVGPVAAGAGWAFAATRGQQGQQHLSSTISTAVLPPQHGSLHINYLPPSTHWKNRPGCNKWRSPTTEVRFVLLMCLLDCE